MPYSISFAERSDIPAMASVAHAAFENDEIVSSLMCDVKQEERERYDRAWYAGAFDLMHLENTKFYKATDETG